MNIFKIYKDNKTKTKNIVWMIVIGEQIQINPRFKM